MKLPARSIALLYTLAFIAPGVGHGNEEGRPPAHDSAAKPPSTAGTGPAMSDTGNDMDTIELSNSRMNPDTVELQRLRAATQE